MKYNIIITAGGTSEKIDNVRKITNSSSGKLGQIIAMKLIELHEDDIDTIYYVCSKNSYKPVHKKVKIVEITDTEHLKNSIVELLTKTKIDYFIHSMAVSDYKVQYVTTVEKMSDTIKHNLDKDINEIINNHENNLVENKISSNENNLIIKLTKTPKIISLIKNLSPKTYLVGFKLLDNVSKNVLLETAVKLKEKNKCDIVVANDLNTIRKGTHEAFIIKSKNDYITAMGKDDIAYKLIGEIMR